MKQKLIFRIQFISAISLLLFAYTVVSLIFVELLKRL